MPITYNCGIREEQDEDPDFPLGEWRERGVGSRKLYFANKFGASAMKVCVSAKIPSRLVFFYNSPLFQRREFRQF